MPYYALYLSIYRSIYLSIYIYIYIYRERERHTYVLLAPRPRPSASRAKGGVRRRGGRGAPHLRCLACIMCWTTRLTNCMNRFTAQL